MRIPDDELKQHRAKRLDWPRMIRELSANGVPGDALAVVCARSSHTVDNWKNHGGEPRHSEGATILALHERFCGSGEKSVKVMLHKPDERS